MIANIITNGFGSILVLTTIKQVILQGFIANTVAPLPPVLTVDVKLGFNPSTAYSNTGSIWPRELNLAAQKRSPKPYPPEHWIPGYDLYAEGGGLYPYLNNSGA